MSFMPKKLIAAACSATMLLGLGATMTMPAMADGTAGDGATVTEPAKKYSVADLAGVRFKRLIGTTPVYFYGTDLMEEVKSAPGIADYTFDEHSLPDGWTFAEDKAPAGRRAFTFTSPDKSFSHTFIFQEKTYTALNIDTNGGDLADYATPVMTKIDEKTGKATVTLPTADQLTKTGFLVDHFLLNNGTDKLAPGSEVELTAATNTAKVVWVRDPNAVEPVTVWRLYHEGVKEHLYTSDPNEYKVLATRGWNQEGAAFTMASAGKPVYRLNNDITKRHHLTMNANEYEVLGTRGWDQEGIAWQGLKVAQ